MRFEHREIHKDLVIVGAGAPGICAAIQAAREGLSVALINDRGCVGGNCGVEIFVSCGGANDGNSYNINLREGGIIDEIRVECKYRSVKRNRFALDGAFMDALEKEENISLFLNTCIDEADLSDDGRILSVSGTQNTTETRYTFYAPLFVDDTGDGTLGALSGAEYMIGREGKETFNERVAPDEPDSFVIPSTLTFWAHDTGEPVRYVAPDYAVDIAKSGALSFREIPHDTFHSFQWFYEGDGALDQVKDQERIIRDHRALVYGIWDYIKNSGKYPEAENYELYYVSVMPGLREYRRLCGDHILIESDLVEQRDFEDAVAHGGWNIDLHAIHGFFDDDLINRHIGFRGAYQIPYRCSYSRNVPNMFMCGRCMSTSHVAFGSTRVAATLSTLGQAVGMAAAICREKNVTPRGVYERHIRELQQRLLREDQLIPGLRNEDERDLARSASVRATSQAALTLEGEEIKTRIGEGLALVLPMAQPADVLELTCRSEEDAELTYHVYRPVRGYNFGPDEKIFTGSVKVAGGDEWRKVALPVDMLEPGSYYFFELLSGQDIVFQAAGQPLPNTVQHHRYRNQSTTNWNYYDMGMEGYSYRRGETCLAYRFLPEQKPYGAENILNGFNRAFEGTGMWLSDREDRTPSLTLSWEKPVSLSMVQITFAIDTSANIEHYDRPLFDRISRDYRLYGITGGQERLLCEVRGNRKKRNRLTFEKGTFDAIRFDFEHNQGGQVGVYEVRAEE